MTRSGRRRTLGEHTIRSGGWFPEPGADAPPPE